MKASITQHDILSYCHRVNSKGKKRILSSRSIHHLLVHNYQNTNKLIGYITEISQQDITLITKNGETYLIPKEKVNSIIVPKKWRLLFIILAIYFGINGFAGLAAFLEGGWLADFMLILGVVSTGLAVLFALLAKPKVIEEPFSEKWKMEQVVEQKSVNASRDNQRP